MGTQQSDLERMQATVATSLHEHWGMYLVEGVVLALLGFAAVLLPALATFAVEAVIGWVLLFSGTIGLISAVRMHRTPGFWWSLASALIGIAAGIVLLRWPLSGAFSLTVVLTAFLVLEGCASIMLAINHRRESAGRWGMLLVSGIIDLMLAGLIFMGLPATAAWAIGLLIGVNLLCGGSALISMALRARSAPIAFPSINGAART